MRPSVEPASPTQKRRQSSSSLGSAITARKLAASLWRSSHCSGLFPSTHLSRRRLHHSTRDEPTASPDVDGHARRRAGTSTDNASKFLGLHMQSLELKHQTSTFALQADLEMTKAQIRGFFEQQRTYEEEKARMKKELAQEKWRWQERRKEVVVTAVKPLKQELEREKSSKERLEQKVENLYKELSEAKAALIRAKRDLQTERKAWKGMEEMCEGLARKVSEEKAHAEDLKRECEEAREEVEEERKMLEMADEWRQERVEMKIEDAELELEAKKAAMDDLRRRLEASWNWGRSGKLAGRSDVLHEESKKKQYWGCGQASSSGGDRVEEKEDDLLQLLLLDDDDFHSIEPNRRRMITASSSSS